MSSPNTAPDTVRLEPTAREVPKVQLSVVQIVASALAAVSAAVISSFFGVAGTVIGAAIGSITATVGSAVYATSLRRTNERLRRLAPTGPRVAGRRSLPSHPLPRVRWRPVLATSVGVFAVAIGVITAIELSTQTTVAHIVSGGSGGHDTSVGQIFGGSPATHPPTSHRATPATRSTPTPTPAATSSGVATPHSGAATTAPATTAPATTSPPASPQPAPTTTPPAPATTAPPSPSGGPGP